MRKIGSALSVVVGITLIAFAPAYGDDHSRNPASVPQGENGNEAAADKEAYDLFHPVPEKQLREFSPDRPGAPYSPFTVDAGHLAYEIEFTNAVFDQNNGVTIHAVNYPSPTIRLGLTSQFEIQATFTPSVFLQTEENGTKTTTRGMGDLILRVKQNVLEMTKMKWDWESFTN